MKDEVPELREIIKITHNQVRQCSEFVNFFVIKHFSTFCNGVVKKYQDIIN